MNSLLRRAATAAGSCFTAGVHTAAAAQLGLHDLTGERLPTIGLGFVHPDVPVIACDTRVIDGIVISDVDNVRRFIFGPFHSYDLTKLQRVSKHIVSVTSGYVPSFIDYNTFLDDKVRQNPSLSLQEVVSLTADWVQGLNWKGGHGIHNLFIDNRDVDEPLLKQELIIADSSDVLFNVKQFPTFYPRRQYSCIGTGAPYVSEVLKAVMRAEAPRYVESCEIALLFAMIGTPTCGGYGMISWYDKEKDEWQLSRSTMQDLKRKYEVNVPMELPKILTISEGNSIIQKNIQQLQIGEIPAELKEFLLFKGVTTDAKLVFPRSL